MPESTHEIAEGAVQQRVSEGATVEGGDVASVVAATIAALDTAASKLPLESARAVVVVFADDGAATVHALDDKAASALALEGGEAVTADAIRGYLAATDSAEDEPERGSLPPPPME